jgi:succinate-semialdehyde dehydrogenase/glutarate-semialdehyde dehydrogenase
MELGGNAPFIVFDDADLEAAVQGALASKYRNAGQTCVCANRFLVQESVYDEFAQRLAAAAATFKLGNGADAAAKVRQLIDDATGMGARLLAGGDSALGGNFIEPTVLTEVDTRMRVFNEEIFGPVAPLIRFRDEAEAITLANATPFGLAAYFYARDIGRVWRVSEELEYGIVGANAGLISNPMAPFGGIKESGHGREGSKYGLDDYLDIKYLCLGGIAR